MKKSYWFFSLVLVAVVFFIEYDLTQRTSRLNTSKLSVSSLQTKSAKNVTAGGTDLVSSSDNSQNKSFTKKFTEVSDEISQLQQNPSVADEKIQTLAASLSAQEMNQLSQVMGDKKSSGDQRAMAVEILARNRTVQALKKLENFIKDHDDTVNWSRSREFESVLRAQAVEGIAAFPQKDLAISSLTSLDQRVSESFLKDRIRRSVSYLRNQALSPEKQDDEALGKLVE